MSHELPKAYDPGAIESRWAEYWVTEKLFHVTTPDSSGNVFDLLLPPPNVTGRLHMGHMLNQTEMDIIIRWHRMCGEKTLWLPGTDHAGIATQMMVERQLATENKKRQDMGREKFVERVWEWKRHYGGAILDQMKRLGASVDWQREYFTMDENLSVAVRECFVRLYETKVDGERLIYRGKYIVNWCPRCMTAISDLEVVHEETQGKLYEVKYPIVSNDGGMNDFITIATTRPETILADTAVAVNPKDDRYKHLVGKFARVPLVNREVAIIADDWANPEFGTGAVKITPAHDPNDFAVGQRHNLAQINIMDESAKLNENAGAYAGLDRFAARKKVLADLEAQGLLAKVKDHTLSIGKCDRCKTVVEPRLSTQWFVKIAPLAKRAIDVVEKGHIKFTPENYKTIYLNWMNNIYDWCISRQLWWGHRIPAWHCGDCKQDTVARETPTKCAHCGSANIEQDTDVLDTWFSSALLPFTTFGWPNQTKDLEVFYPTSLLITGFDILFFWVARMIMMGCWFMGAEDKLDVLPAAEREERLKNSVPFEDVYIHALVRDADRQKMSKTKGNVIDPIEIIERFGTDAVRFTLASMAAPGTDIAFNEDRTEGYRAFANKIWNAARFIFMNVDRAQESGVWAPTDFSALPLSATYNRTFKKYEDLWIAASFDFTAHGVNEALEAYRFDEAAALIYRFFWTDFCDWYLEMVKVRLAFEEPDFDAGEAREALANLLQTFELFLRLISPFMPFITEEIWHALYDGRPPLKSIAKAHFPRLNSIHAALGKNPAPMSALQAFIGGLRNQLQESLDPTKMADFQSLVGSVRNQRAVLGVPPRAKIVIQVFAGTNEWLRNLLQSKLKIVQKLANVEKIEFSESSLSGLPGFHAMPYCEIRVVYEQKIDVAAERERLSKELKRLEIEMANAHRQLSNEQFLAKASEKVVEGVKRRSAELSGLMGKIKDALANLDGADAKK